MKYMVNMTWTDVEKARGERTIVAPPFSWGICQSTRGYIGSFSIRMETAMGQIYDILNSLKSFGFHEVYGINAHGDIEQNVLLMNSFKNASENLAMKARYLFRKEVLHFYGLTGQEDHICPVEPQTLITSGSREPDVHAGDIETAIIHRYWPDCVDVEKASQLPPVTIPEGRDMEWLPGGNTKAMSVDGYIGNPALFDRVLIEKHMEDMTERYVDAILMKRRAEPWAERNVSDTVILEKPVPHQAGPRSRECGEGPDGRGARGRCRSLAFGTGENWSSGQVPGNYGLVSWQTWGLI